MKKFIFGALLTALFFGPAQAQQNKALIVSACGTLPFTYTAGQQQLPTIDVNGKLCSAGSAGSTPTGNPVPSFADYMGLNVAGTLRGWTGVNPSGSIYAGQVDIASVAGVTAAPVSVSNAGVTASTGVAAVQGATGGIPVLITPTSDYPAGATPITGNATGTTGAVVGTLTSVSNKTTYICGFTVDVNGGVASIGPITVAGLTGSSMVFQLFSTATGANRSLNFNRCVPASGTNINITITTTADGTASAVSVNSWGYNL